MHHSDDPAAEIAARIEALSQVCAADPRSPRFVELGRLLLDADRHQDAYAALRTGLHHRPDDLEGHLLFGEARLRLGQLSQSIDEFEWVLARAPDNVDALLLLGRALEWNGRTLAARAALERARTADPTDPRPGEALRRLDGVAHTPIEDVDDDTAASPAAVDDRATAADQPGLPEPLGVDDEPTEAMSRDALSRNPAMPWGRASLDVGVDDATSPGTARSEPAVGVSPLIPRIGARPTMAQVSGPGAAIMLAGMGRGASPGERDTVAENPPTPLDGRGTMRGVGPNGLPPTNPGVDEPAGAPSGSVMPAGARAPRAIGLPRRGEPLLPATRELDASDLRKGAAELGRLERTRELQAADLARVTPAGGPPSAEIDDDPTGETDAPWSTRAIARSPTGSRLVERGPSDPIPRTPLDDEPTSDVDRAWMTVDRVSADEEPTRPEGPRPHTVHLPDRGGRRAESPAPRAQEPAPVPVPPAEVDGGRPTVNDGDPTGRFEAPRRPARAPNRPVVRPPAERERAPKPVGPIDRGPAPPGVRSGTPVRGSMAAPSPEPRRPAPAARPAGGAPMPSPTPRSRAPAPPPMPSPHPRRRPAPPPATPAPSPHPRVAPPNPAPRAHPPSGPAPTPAPRAPMAPPPQVPVAPLSAVGRMPAPDPTPFGAPPPSEVPTIDAGTRGSAFDLEPPIPPIEPPPARTSAPVTPSRSPWLRIVALAVAVVVLLAALVATLRYRRTVEVQQAEVESVVTRLADGNFGSRVDVAERLARPVEAAGFMARLGDRAARIAGRPGLSGPAARRTALRARVEAERWALFGELGRREAAVAAVATAETEAAGMLDTVIARTLVALAEGRVADARAVVDGAGDTGSSAADGDWIDAVVAQAEARNAHALEQARRAAERDTDHPFAPTLYGELLSEGGDIPGALGVLQALLDGDRAGHADTRIAFERLRIASGKRAGEAVGNLEALLDDADTRLSPAQTARIHDGIGLYHAEAGELDRARAAYVRSMESAPGDPRFMRALGELDLRRYALDEADDVIARAARLAPDDAGWTVLAARVALARGDAERALRMLEAVDELSADGRIVLADARVELAGARTGDDRKALLEAAEKTYRSARTDDKTNAHARIGAWLAAYLRAGDAKDFDALRKARTIREGLSRDDRTLPFRAYARALMARKRYRAAERQFRSALEIDERDYRAHYGVCRASAGRLDAKDALKGCRAALEINPHHAPAAHDLARVAEARRDAGAVIAALSPRAQRAPLPPVEARRLARAFVEQDALDRMSALYRGDFATEDDATRRYVQGLEASARGKLSEARDLLYAAADQLVTDAWVQVAYADLLLKQDQAPQAATYFRRAMSADKEPYAALGLAHAELDRAQPTAARTAAREAEKRASRSLSHPRVRAEALAVQARARVMQGGRRNLRRAQRLIRKANGVEPDLPETLIASGLLAEAQRKPEVAIARYRRLTQVAPKQAEGFFRLGQLLFAEPDTREQGRTELTRAGELDPEGVWGARARQLLGG